jgi:hypothetical protein
MGLGIRGGPVTPNLGKRQAFEAVGIDRAARAKFGVIGAASDGAPTSFSLAMAAVKPDGPSSMIGSPERWR